MKLKALLIAIALIMGGVAAAVPTTSASAATNKPCVQKISRKGSSGPCVEYVQNMLNLADQAGLTPDGKFGTKTKAAVKAWQSKRAVAVDGVVGPQTWGTFCAVFYLEKDYDNFRDLAGCKSQKCTDRTFSSTNNPWDNCVTYLKTMLNLSMDAKLSINATFDSQATTAVKAWQKQKSIKKDGIVGPQTWGTLCRHKPATALQDGYASLKNTVGCR